jgi:hypothetical protein
VAAGHGRNGREEATVLFPIDRHDVAQLHDARMSDRDAAGNRTPAARACGSHGQRRRRRRRARSGTTRASSKPRPQRRPWRRTRTPSQATKASPPTRPETHASVSPSSGP